MKYHLRFFLLLSFFQIPLVFASQPGEIFTCYTRDDAGVDYNYQSQYKREAINKSYSLCKKSSKDPTTCKTSEASCESSINGVSTAQFWECTALDQMGKSYVSNIYRQKYDAAIAAKDYCKSKSGVPNTCYINLLTCKNINE